jgi:imidazolonepropionase-like amidohydrolase
LQRALSSISAINGPEAPTGSDVSASFVRLRAHSAPFLELAAMLEAHLFEHLTLQNHEASSKFLSPAPSSFVLHNIISAMNAKLEQATAFLRAATNARQSRHTRVRSLWDKQIPSFVYTV